jgi:hypothetical protein
MTTLRAMACAAATNQRAWYGELVVKRWPHQSCQLVQLTGRDRLRFPSGRDASLLSWLNRLQKSSEIKRAVTADPWPAGRKL